MSRRLVLAVFFLLVAGLLLAGCRTSPAVPSSGHSVSSGNSMGTAPSGNSMGTAPSGNSMGTAPSGNSMGTPPNKTGVFRPTMAPVPPGAPGTIYLINDTEVFLTDIHISNVNCQSWGPEQLGPQNVMPAHSTFEFTGVPPGQYDIKATFNIGGQHFYNSEVRNVVSNTRTTLRYDGNTQTIQDTGGNTFVAPEQVNRSW